MTIEQTYREIFDKNLIKFISDNMTPKAKGAFGIFTDSDGIVKMPEQNYVSLVNAYIEILARSGGKIKGTLDIRNA